jgi:pimeloyl-ACP methyl ester carboxylesterase
MSAGGVVHVVALPGGVMPAAQRYATLAAALGPDVELHTKDLEVYSEPQPPAGYSIQMEVAAVTRFADALGLDRFHLLGYSGGGYVSLAVAGAHPERLLSLALFEPAAVPGAPTAAERELRQLLEAGLAGKTGAEFMRAFMTLQLRDGVELPPPPEPPAPALNNRPAGLRAMMAAFDSFGFDRETLRECRFPVFYGYGDLTGVHQEVWLGALAQLLPDLHLRRFGGIHHFVPPARIYSPEHVEALRELWAKAESAHGRD